MARQALFELVMEGVPNFTILRTVAAAVNAATIIIAISNTIGNPKIMINKANRNNGQSFLILA